MLAFFCDSVGMSHVLPNISRSRFFEPIFMSKKFDLYTSIYGTLFYFNPIWPGLFWGAWAWGGEGWEVLAAHNSKTIHGIGIKFDRVQCSRES